VSIYRWIAYVSGAVLLGYLFNFVRLCILVLYYRVALGHTALEGFAKWADYCIGSGLFLVATLLFIRLIQSKQNAPASERTPRGSAAPPLRVRNLVFQCVAFAVVLLLALSLPSSALRPRPAPSPESLAARMPKQIGSFTLKRTWYETEGSTIVVQSGAYSAPGTDEIILGIWVAPIFYLHDATQCWLARGLEPDSLIFRSFVIAGGETLPLRTGFYSDGITDSIVVNGVCTPASCSQFQKAAPGTHLRLLFLKPDSTGISGTGAHPVSIMLRIERLRSDTPKAVTYSQLSGEAQKFLAGLDMKSLSRSFQ